MAQQSSSLQSAPLRERGAYSGSARSSVVGIGLSTSRAILASALLTTAALSACRDTSTSNAASGGPSGTSQAGTSQTGHGQSAPVGVDAGQQRGAAPIAAPTLTPAPGSVPVPPPVPLDKSSAPKGAGDDTSEHTTPQIVAKEKVADLEVVVTERETSDKSKMEGLVYVVLYDEEGEMVGSAGSLTLKYSIDGGKPTTKTVVLEAAKFKEQIIPGEDDNTFTVLVDTVPGQLDKTISVDATFDGRVSGDGELVFGSSVEPGPDDGADGGDE